MSKKKKNKKFKNKYKNATLASTQYTKPTSGEEVKETLFEQTPLVEEVVGEEMPVEEVNVQETPVVAVEEVPAEEEVLVQVEEPVVEEPTMEEVVEPVVEEPTEAFFEDRLSPLFTDIQKEEDPGYFDETMEFTALSNPEITLDDVIFEAESDDANGVLGGMTLSPELEEPIIELQEEVPLVEDAVIQEEPVVVEETYVYEEPVVEEPVSLANEDTFENDIAQVVGQPVWIHDKIANKSFISGYMILKTCTCGVCGYHSNAPKDVCPNCKTEMQR